MHYPSSCILSAEQKRKKISSEIYLAGSHIRSFACPAGAFKFTAPIAVIKIADAYAVSGGSVHKLVVGNIDAYMADAPAGCLKEYQVAFF